jgi:hypothetical protein
VPGLDPGIHVFLKCHTQFRGWPGQTRPQDAAHAGYNWRMSAKCAIAGPGKLKISPKMSQLLPMTLVNAI